MVTKTTSIPAKQIAGGFLYTAPGGIKHPVASHGVFAGRLALNAVKPNIIRRMRWASAFGLMEHLAIPLREQEFTKVPLIGFILSNQKQPTPTLALPLKGREHGSSPFKGEVGRGMGGNAGDMINGIFRISVSLSRTSRNQKWKAVLP